MPWAEVVEEDLFEDLMESVREAGAMLRARGASRATGAIEAVTQVTDLCGHLSSRGASQATDDQCRQRREREQRKASYSACSAFNHLPNRAQMIRAVGNHTEH